MPFVVMNTKQARQKEDVAKMIPMPDTSHISGEVMDAFARLKHKVLAWNSLFLLVPAIVSWGNGYTFFCFANLYECIVAVTYWSTWRKGHPLRYPDILGSAVILLTSAYNCTLKRSDPVTALIWWAMCMSQVFFWYTLSLGALHWDTRDKHLHALQYHLNFRAPLMMATILVVSDTTWDQMLLYLGITIVASQMVTLYALNVSMVHCRALVSISFPYPYLWAVALYMSIYFYFFGAPSGARSIDVFSFYYTLSLEVVLCLVVLHYVVFRASSHISSIRMWRQKVQADVGKSASKRI